MDQFENVKFGFKVPFYPLDLIFELADYAESSILDSIWSADHMIGMNPEKWDAYSAWAILSIIANRTKRCLIGSSVSDPCRIHPAVLSQIAMTLQEISDGRFILGLGAGEALNTEPYGIPCDKPVSRLVEAIKVIKALQSSKNVEFRGKYMRLSKASISPLPRKASPLWIAANSPKTVEVIGQMGDGWLPMAIKFSPEDYGKNLARIRNIASLSGRNPEAIEPALFLHTLASKNGDNARKRVKDMAKLLLMMWVPQLYEEMGYIIDKNFYADRLVYNDETVHRIKKMIDQLPDEPIYEHVVAGNPEECISAIHSYVKAGARHIVLSILGGPDTIKDDLRFYIEQVVSYFKV